VDHIIEVGGGGTLQQSFKCVKLEGIISVIGFLGGVDPETQPTVLETLTHICTVRGVYVGSKALMRDMVRAIEANDIHPVVDDKVFSLEKTKEAYEYLVSSFLFVIPLETLKWLDADSVKQWAQKHFGKLTIKIN